MCIIFTCHIYPPFYGYFCENKSIKYKKQKKESQLFFFIKKCLTFISLRGIFPRFFYIILKNKAKNGDKMYKKILSIILLGACLYLFAFSESKALDVSFIREPVEIDGELDEEFYQNLTAVDDFVQYHPQNGEKPTFKTQVYTFYDKNNIYFSFKCFDDEPGKITADVTPFGRYGNNDEVKVHIDTFSDKRTYKGFAVNPRGIKKGEPTVWDADAKITDFGWSAEIKIPTAISCEKFSALVSEF
jgi:hypothetical protein